MKRYVLVGAGLFLLLIYGLVVRELWRTYQTDSAASQRSVESLAVLLESHTASALNATDVMLQGIAEVLRHRPDLLMPDNREGRDLLTRQLSFTPGLSNIGVYDRQGRVLYDALGELKPGLDLSDRDYFQALRRRPHEGLVVGRPVPSRVDERLIVPLGRALLDAQGEFVGVVATVLDAGILAVLLGGADLGGQGGVGLFYADGSRLASQGQAPLDLALEQGGSVERILEIADAQGTPFVFARRYFEDYPFMLILARSLQADLADWRRQMLIGIGVALLLTVIVGLSVWLLLRQIQRRRVMDRQLRQQAAIMEQISDALVVTEPKGIIRDWNRAAQTLFGYSREEVLGRRPGFLYHPALRDLARKSIRRGMEHEGGWSGELYLQHRDGTGLYCDTVIAPLFDDGNQISGWVSVNRDISHRKRAEAQLRDSEARLRTTLDNLLDGVVNIDAQGTIRWVNQATERLFGYPAAELIGRNVKMLMPEPYRSQHDGYLARYLKTGEARIIGIGREVEGLRRDGSSFPLELAVSEVRANGEWLFTGVVRDITERKRVERLKNEFVSTVSHELRTPLTSIRGALGLVTGNVAGELPAKAKNLIGIAHKNSERLVALVNDILDIQKIESGHMEFQFQRVDLKVMIQQGLEENQAFAQQHGVTLRAQPPPHETCVYGDPARLMQVLTNLLSNAAKFSPRDSEVTVTVSAREGQFRVSVRDQGPGIPEGFRARIFDKFAQADSSSTREKSGTGLGLSIAQAIVERHAGHIGFDTAPDEGTTFWFELPIYQQAPEQEASPDDFRPRLLVCEDDPSIASLLTLMLEQQGYAVDQAGSAGQAWELLSQRRYLAMTVDLDLPDQDGLSLVRRLREQEDGRQHLPVVVVSAWADDQRQYLQGEALGIVDWLTKPFDHRRLGQAVKAAARRARDRKARLLHVEDDPDVGKVVAALLEGRVELDTAATVAAARQRLRERQYDLVLLDVGLPDGSGLSLVDDIKNQSWPPPVLVFSAEEQDSQSLAEVGRSFVKSRTSNHELVDTIKALIEQWSHEGIQSPSGEQLQETVEHVAEDTLR